MKCPTCGAENEASNRFCEQCGSRMAPSGEFQPAAAASLASAPTAAAATCPSCGAPVLPGEAFCDNCGAALNNVVPAASPASISDAPTVLAQPAPSLGSAQASGQGVVCPTCGHQNLPGDRFCDNCGAELAQQPATAGPATAQAQSQPAPDASSNQAAVDANAATAEQPGLPPADASAAPAPSAPAAAPSANTGAAAPSSYEADKQRLNDEIERQQKIIEQFEQMQSMFGAATPPAVVQGLSDARDARARAEAELNALQPPAPAVDPAEVARLNDEIERQQKIIEQFEQMQTMFGAATPPAVVQGLSDARDARARAEAELNALNGTAAPAPAAPSAAETAPEPPTATPPAPVGPSSAPAPSLAAAPATAEAPALEEPPAPSATVPPAAPVAPPVPSSGPAAPRLVMDDGRELALPTDKREIIIGREDPISGIFPEVDLTPFGGESGGVSRQHARLNNDNGQWTLTDLNSTNYTRVNGAKIEPNTPVPLTSGAKLQFGRVALTFQV